MAQFELIRLMAPTYNDDGEIDYNLCVVGDDDQSIYRFRGANIYNILNFEKHFSDTKIIKLEQNYRSTKNILNAANGIIENNIGRKRKSLWTENEEGEPIYFSFQQNEYMEAAYIVEDIAKILSNNNLQYQDFAILYRTNAQSRVLEEKLILKNIPYKIVGTVNFYQRREIKDLLCYLKTIDNGQDDLAVKRIINVPRRGIGLTTIDRVSDYAYQHQLNFYEALTHAESIPGIGRSTAKINSFVSLIEVLKSKLSSSSYSLATLLNEILDSTGYQRNLEEEHTEEADGRLENISELLNKIVTYEQNSVDEPTLNGFLEEVALVADIDTLEENIDRVVLMTLHNAKGLEFPYVYLSGMEEGIFPSYLAISADNEEELEEERRLCYVGITRAMKHLTLTAARERMRHGDTIFSKPSRFIQEIPQQLIKEVKQTQYYHPNLLYTNTTPSASKSSTRKGNNAFANNPYISKGFSSKNPLDSPPDYKIGDTVQHIKFGTGIIINLEKGLRDYEVTVSFTNTGTKKMLASFAKLKKL